MEEKIKNKIHFILLLIIFFGLFGAAKNVDAATYFINPSGSNADGLTDETAYISFSELKNHRAMQTGDDVYFKSGGTWQEQVVVDWSGTGGNQVVIGAYYMNAGVETVGVSGNKPTFEGHYPQPGCNWNIARPNNVYQGLIQANYVSYVTIQDLRVVNSGARGITVGSDDDTSSHHCHVLRCDIIAPYDTGIVFFKMNRLSATGTQGGTGMSIIEGNTIIDSNEGQYDNCDAAGTGNAITANLSRNVSILRNTLLRGKGEGIGLYNNQDTLGLDFGYATIAYNTMIDTRYPVYVVGFHNCNIAYNLIYFTGGEVDWSETTLNGITYGSPAIYMGTEDDASPYGETNNNWIYGNFVAGSYAALGIEEQDAAHDSFSGIKFFNNTAVNCAFLMTAGGDDSVKIAFEKGSDNEVKNNILWNFSGIPTALGGKTEDHPVSGISFDHNLWSSQPEWVIARGANDPEYASPQLVKTTGWNSITPYSLSRENFMLQPGSPARDAGANLGSLYNTDYWGTVRPTDAWDIGAYEYAGGSGPAPASPSGLSVR